MKILKTVAAAIAAVVFAVSAYYVFSPLVDSIRSGYETGEAVSAARVQIDSYRDTAIAVSPAEPVQEAEGTAAEDLPPAQDDTIVDSVYLKAQAFNRDLIGNQELIDYGWWNSVDLDLSPYGIEDQQIGVIEIPSIELEMPLYLAATYEHLAKGCVVMGGTSLPIGGENTHTVIAGHRGYRGGDYLINIEDIAIGDQIVVTNLWGQVSYTAAEIKVIEPWDTTPLYIDEGQRLLTLLTCHPYGSGGRYRYLVVCTENVPEQATSPTTNEIAGSEPTALESNAEMPTTQTSILPDLTEQEIPIESSDAVIFWKRLIPWLGGLIVVVLVAAVFLKRRK